MTSNHTILEHGAQIQEATRTIAQMLGKPGANAYLDFDAHGFIRGRVLFKSSLNPTDFWLITLFYERGLIRGVYTDGKLSPCARHIEEGAFDIGTLPKNWYAKLNPHSQATKTPVLIALKIYEEMTSENTSFFS